MLLQRVLAFLLGLTLAFAFGAAVARAQEAPNWNQIIDQTNFEVDARCSGTLIDVEKRLVLTAYHCVEQGIGYEYKEEEVEGELKKKKKRKLEGLQVAQYFYNGFRRVQSVSYEVDIVAYANEYDLAVVKIAANIPNTMASPIAKDDPPRGARIKVVGNPQLEYGSIMDGTVGSVQRQISTGDSYKRDVIQVSGMYFGNSGGAIYNEAGELVGVPHVKYRGTDILGYAIPASTINKFLKDNCAALDTCEGKDATKED